MTTSLLRCSALVLLTLPIVPLQAGDSNEDIARLVKQLGISDYRTRDSATKQLTEIGEPALSLAGWPGEDKQRLAEDVKLLQAAGVVTNGPGLLEFFRKNTLSAEQRPQIKELIQQLGSKSYKVREKATRQLIALGPVAVPDLKNALQHADIEVVKRAEHCLEARDADPLRKVLPAAVRVLAARERHHMIGVLLAFLPYADDPDVEEEIVLALAGTTARDGKADPLLIQALAAELPLVRAAAGQALARAGLPEHQKAVRKLLDDPQPSVRLRVCTALVCAGNKELMPVLIKLEGPYCQIRSVHSGKVLAFAGECSQKWDPAHHILSPADAGDTAKNGANLIQVTANAGSKTQQWLLLKWNKHYVIVNRDSGKVLDVPNGSKDGLVPIHLWDYGGAPKQQWSIEKWGDYSVIRSRCSSLVLNLAYGEPRDGGIILQYSFCQGASNELWELVPVK